MMFPALVLIPFAVATAGSEATLTFEKDVRPILKAHCMHCHGEEEKPEGGVDLRLRRFMDSLIVPGTPSKSKLLEVVRSGEMPKKGKPLGQTDIRVLETWIAQGAKTARPEPPSLPPGPVISEEDRQHWAFQPVRRPVVPDADRNPNQNPIDAFVVSKLKEAGLPLAPEADRRTLIRRVALDLTGILPTPEEVDAFVADSSPEA
jgi:hypothetical protein